jgi:serine/threonine protein kinase
MAAPNEKQPAGKGDKNAPVDLSMIGPYKLVSNIASGNHSQVWEALTADGQRRIAVKFLYGEAVKDQEQLAAIKNEFTVGKQLEHPNIIKFLDGHWGTLFKKEAYFTMELFMSPNLKAQLFNNLNSVQVRFKRIVESCAMAFAHIQDKGFIHRDIKPDNILEVGGGEGHRLFARGTSRRCALEGLRRQIEDRQGDPLLHGPRADPPPAPLLPGRHVCLWHHPV